MATEIGLSFCSCEPLGFPWGGGGVFSCEPQACEDLIITWMESDNVEKVCCLMKQDDDETQASRIFRILCLSESLCYPALVRCELPIGIVKFAGFDSVSWQRLKIISRLPGRALRQFALCHCLPSCFPYLVPLVKVIRNLCLSQPAIPPNLR